MKYGIEAYRIVAYAFDAAIYCNYHTERRYGLQEGRKWVREDAVDSEGNSVHPVFSSDHEGSNQTYCADDINEIICLICGVTTVNREFGDPCWNCNSAWYTEDYE